MKNTTTVSILYQKDSKGKVKVWTIQAIDHGSHSEILSTSGQEGGKMTPDSTLITEGKNIGKANETTHFEQAVSEMHSKRDAKIRQGYVYDKKDIKESSDLGSGIKSPMLAEKYDPTKKQKKSKDLKDLGLVGKKIGVQRKKDGNRSKIIVSHDGVKMFTRKGDEQPILEHITDTILENYKKKYKPGSPALILDGELYTKAFSFNKLNGLVKKEKKSAEDLALCQHIKYHVYDAELPVCYTERHGVISQFGSATVHVEEVEYIIATVENINEKLEKYLEEEEEGLMIRVLEVPYQNKRTFDLLKCKIFEDKEFTVVGFEESVKRGMVGAVICQMDQPAKDRSGKPIETFRAGLKKGHDEATEIWNNQSKYIGKKGTVEFFGRSEYGVPRFPKFKDFR